MKGGSTMSKKGRTSKRIMVATIIVSIIPCMIIIIGFCVHLFHFEVSQEASNSKALEEVFVENIYSQESLTLSLVGVAISVWVGLNLYNVFSKEELRTLEEELQGLQQELQNLKKEAQMQLTDTHTATERVYTEMLKSKFRISSSSTASKYFATQLEYIDPLPSEFSERIFELEDLFQISYHLYGEGISSKDNPKGAVRAEQLKKAVEECFISSKVNFEQYKFLMGYGSWRLGDFLYYQARYNKFYTWNQRRSTALHAIGQYKEVGWWLFSIQNIADFYNQTRANPENQDFLAYLANDIASAYIDIIRDLSDETLNEAIEIEKIAVEFSEDLPDKVRERFLRNLGCAYEKMNDMESALEQYKKAYKTYSGNYLCAHCIGSWYRKQALKHFYPNLKPQELAEKKLFEINNEIIDQLSNAEREELIKQLNQAVYWYSVKQINNYGKMESRLVELNHFLHRLTKNCAYSQKKIEAREHEDFANEILQTP